MSQNRNSKLENRNSRTENRPTVRCDGMHDHPRAVLCRSRESGNPSGQTWTPAFARVTRMKRGNPLSLAFLLVALLVAGLPSFAQVATGLPPYASFSGGPFDSVNNANLNVHFAIPVVAKAGRGLPFNYLLNYDSSIWVPVGASGNQTWTPVGQTTTTPSTWGWAGTAQAITGFVTYWITQGQCSYDAKPYNYTIYSSWAYIDGSGTSHPFPGLSVSNGNSTPCSPTQYPSYSGNATASDGSGWQIVANAGPGATVYSVSGVAIVPPLGVGVPTSGGPYTLTDMNGNVISYSSGTGVYTDTGSVKLFV